MPLAEGTGLAERFVATPDGVAVERAILTTIWSMAHTGALYDDPGPDYYTRRDPDRFKRHALRQLERLGYDVTLTPLAATA
jgi:hypothetical protein